MSLTKADIIKGLIDEIGVTHRQASDLAEAFFLNISESLEAGHPVKLARFGNFELRDKPARLGRNPRTMQEVTIDSRRVATFKAGNTLKERVARECPF